jgi:hypothetical protein
LPNAEVALTKIAGKSTQHVVNSDAPKPVGASLRGLLVAIPDFGLATVFLMTWWRPYTFGETAVERCLLTMVLEFIIVHSSAFMGHVAMSREDRSRRLGAVLGLGLLYSVFVVAFAWGFQSWWPVYAFWGLTLNRMLGIMTGDAPVGRERQYVKAGWALSALYYLGCVVLTSLLPVPALGITSEVQSALDLPGNGQWVDQPQRVLAFGVLYFSLSGLGELLGWARNETFLKGVPSDAK